MNPRRIPVSTGTDWWNSLDLFTLPGRIVNIQGRVLAVDPSCTAPNVVVGVRISDTAAPIYLRPGESIVFPSLISQVYVFNPHAATRAQFSTISATSAVCGPVTLLTGSVDDLVAWRARANRTRATSYASLIGAHITAGIGADPIALVVNGLEKLRLVFQSLTALSVAMPNPADLAATVRMRHAAQLATTTFDPASISRPDPDVGYMNIAAPFNMTLDDAASDFAVSQTQLVMDYEVGAGTVVVIQFLAMAGTGVGRLGVLAYGS